MAIAGHRSPSDSHHSGIGDVVDGRYKIEGVLGRGNWSVVYRATSQRTGHPIALKMLLRGLPCGDERAEKRFFREAQITAALQHPNTLRVFDVGRTSGGALYIASEQLHGPTLEDELRDRADSGRFMSEAEVLEIADAVLRSLSEAHSRGMVHRDLKPGNIVLHSVGSEQVVKVLDFGIASLQSDRITPRGVSLGTPDYMSPEQCASQHLDGRSDLYSLGIILFRALAGRVPFVGENVFDVMKQHRELNAPSVRDLAPQVSEGLSLLIERALAKHPDHRFMDAASMREAVLRAARDLPTQPRLRARSSTRIPRVVVSTAPTQDTGSWRVSASDPVTAATQVATDSVGRVRSTAKYAQVTSQALEAHRTRGPDLQPAPPTPPAPLRPEERHATIRPTVETAAVPVDERGAANRTPARPQTSAMAAIPVRAKPDSEKTSNKSSRKHQSAPKSDAVSSEAPVGQSADDIEPNAQRVQGTDMASEGLARPPHPTDLSSRADKWPWVVLVIVMGWFLYRFW
ncbi:MAG: serine/threonine protein kinase [Myxococcales bacterium]|nr:serine/threonine protein kinase [Myxococcales bacterium]